MAKYARVLLVISVGLGPAAVFWKIIRSFYLSPIKEFVFIRERMQ